MTRRSSRCAALLLSLALLQRPLAIIAALADADGNCTSVSSSATRDATCQGEEERSTLLQTPGRLRLDTSDSAADEPNPPDFGDNVFVVEAGEASKYEDHWQKIYKDWHEWDAKGAQFGDHRTAVLLKPGKHDDLKIDLPYYFSVHGLGFLPTDTVIGARDGLKVDLQENPNSCNTFWRSIENVHLKGPVKFWVSQAAPMRSVVVDGDLEVAGQGGSDYASGGALMNSVVSGNIFMGLQQQWYTRGTKMNPYPNKVPAGSFVCVGCTQQNGGKYSNSYDWDNNQANQYAQTGTSYTEAPEVFAEKPYIFVDDSGKFQLLIPNVQSKRWGPSWGEGSTVPFERVYVAKPSDADWVINDKIKAGKHIVFPPGKYIYSKPIQVSRAGTVLLGLGFATLISHVFEGPLIQVLDVPGVRIAGLLLQADQTYLQTSALLQWGSSTSSVSNSKKDPGFIYDLIGRVGGPESYDVSVKYMVQINSKWVIGDNLWLWSADHCGDGQEAPPAESHWPCVYSHADTALQVNGDHVSMFGLMAEHTEKDIVEWNGEHGQTMFYQSEFRYTMGLKSADPIAPGYACAYRVNARDHRAVGFGIYKVMNDPDPKQWPLSVQGGFSAIAVKHWDTYVWGFKDVSAKNWASSWPTDNKITCKCWDETENTTWQCMDNHVQ